MPGRETSKLMKQLSKKAGWCSFGEKLRLDFLMTVLGSETGALTDDNGSIMKYQKITMKIAHRILDRKTTPTSIRPLR